MSSPINLDSQHLSQSFQSSKSSSIDSILANGGQNTSDSSSEVQSNIVEREILSDEIKKNKIKDEAKNEDALNISIENNQRHGSRLRNINNFI